MMGCLNDGMIFVRGISLRSAWDICKDKAILIERLCFDDER